MATAPQGLHSGDVIGGDFEVVQPLGAGGMGTVYLCRQRSTRRKRAVKVMHPLHAAEPRQRRRFEQEAQVGSLIDSDHIVEVIAAGVDEELELPWLAMEWLDGENFADLVERLGPLDAGATHELMRQVCDALGAAHTAGVVHRDLKPENVFVLHDAGEDGRPFVKLLDFGIANVMAEARGSLTGGVGTPQWMAPEQTELDYTALPASDVWSLGLLAYHLLTGRVFWRGESMAQLINEIMLGPIPEASVRARDHEEALPPALDALSPAFDAWFARCVVRDLDTRFEDAHAAWAELETVLTPPPEGPLGLSKGLTTDKLDTLATATTLSALATAEAPTLPAPTKAPTRRRALVAALAIAGVLGAGVLARTLRPLDPTPTVADAGSPISAEFDAAHRLWKQGRFEASRRAFSVLLANHPENARAALYLGLDGRPSDATRKLLAAAHDHRDTLSAADAELLDASKTGLAPVPDLGEWEQKLRRVVENHPDHGFVWVTLARVCGLRGNLDCAREALVEAEKRDGDVAPAALAVLGRLERDAHDNQRAMKAFDRCLSRVPNASECLAGKARVLALTGQCETLESTARKWIVADAQDSRSHEALALGLSANRADEAAIRIALEAKWQHEDNREELPSFDYAASKRWLDEYHLHALFGRFDDAVEVAQAAADKVPPTAGMMDHYHPNWWLTLAAIEGGRSDLGGKVAMSFVKRARAWTPDNARQTAAPLLFLSMAREHGGMPEGEYRQRRDRWLTLANDAISQAGSSVDSYTRSFPWVIAYAVPAVNEARAKEALEAMPRYEPIPGPGTRMGDVQLVIGNVFAHAGQADKALPYYEGTIHNCLVLENPYAVLFGYVTYARLLVQLGRDAEAIPYLKRVLHYWGHTQSGRYANMARAALAKLTE